MRPFAWSSQVHKRLLQMRASSLFSLLLVLYHQHQLFIVIERKNIPCVFHHVSFIELLAMIVRHTCFEKSKIAILVAAQKVNFFQKVKSFKSSNFSKTPKVKSTIARKLASFSLCTIKQKSSAVKNYFQLTILFSVKSKLTEARQHFYSILLSPSKMVKFHFLHKFQLYSAYKVTVQLSIQDLANNPL